MTPATFLRIAIQPAMTLLPPAMNTPEARAQLLAIALQESDLKARRQVTSNPAYSPARGFWQFELAGGTAEVLTNSRTKSIAIDVLEQLRYPPASSACWEALEHNDVLACIFARLNLWRSPLRLPRQHEADHGWAVYERIWAPGKPHPEKWPLNFSRAWAAVEGY